MPVHFVTMGARLIRDWQQAMHEVGFSLDGVILAGGRAERLGGLDKGLEYYRDKRLIDWAQAAIRPLVKQLLISCNRHHAEYQPFADTLVSDQQADFPGPLHGVLSAMQSSDSSHLLVMPCDTPHIVAAELAQLVSTAQQAPNAIVIAATPDGLQPLHCVIPRQYQHDLASWLSAGNARVQQWYKQHPLIKVEFTSAPFRNLNRHQDFDD